MRKPMVAALVLVMACGAAAAQPAGPGGAPPPPADVPRAGFGNGEELKRRLERWLDEMDEREQRIRDALTRLEAGEEPREVVRGLEGILRMGARLEPGRGEGPRGEGAERRFGPDGPDGPGPGDDRPRPREGEGWGLAGPGQPLTPESRTRVLKFLGEVMPQFAKRLEQYREVDPEAADRFLGRIAPRLQDAARLRNSDPTLFALRVDEVRAGVEVIEAIREVRRAQSAGEDLKAPTARLRETMVAQNEARSKLMAHEITVLEKRIESMKGELRQRDTDAAERIDDVVRRVLEGRGGEEGPGRPGGRPGRKP
ncbi:MAG: hypothetical protein SFY69_10720 [Planctomycetota bacterium]|nr:hypothetical protein [Planctomycetota bacterium]